MEKNNNYKILTVVALFVAVLALAVGFAAYSATLTITNPSAVVTGDQFSPYVLYTGTPSCVASGNATVISEGTLNNKNWTGVSLRMEKPGDSVTCTESVQNGSLLTAYLESIKASKAIECVSYGTGEDDGNPTTNFQSACDGMKLTFKAGTYDIATDEIDLPLVPEEGSNNVTVAVPSITPEAPITVNDLLSTSFNGQNYVDKVINQIDILITYTTSTGAAQSFNIELVVNGQTYTKTVNVRGKTTETVTLSYTGLSINKYDSFSVNNVTDTTGNGIKNGNIDISNYEIVAYFANS